MGNKPRIAIITTHPIQYYAPLFEALAARCRLNIRVFYEWNGSSTGDYDPGFEKEVTWDIPLLNGYPYSFLENKASDPGTHHFRGIIVPDLVPSIEEWGPDAVLIFGWNYWSHLAALRKFKDRLPVFFRGDSTLLDEGRGPYQWIRRAFLRWIYRYVDVGLYVGTRNRRYFEAHGLSESQLEWVPHAIDIDRFADSGESYEHQARVWREQLGIPENTCTIVFAGKLSDKKAPDLLLETFSRLEDSRAHLVVVGSGPLEGKLKRQFNGHPRIHFLGFQNQSRMPVVYRLGEVFVLPSRGPGETWGLAINEAMACGRAVVASEKVGCAPDLIENRENGFVFPANDRTALQEILRTLINDETLRLRMGHASEERIQEWSIERAAKRHEEAILKHLGEMKRV